MKGNYPLGLYKNYFHYFLLALKPPFNSCVYMLHLGKIIFPNNSFAKSLTSLIGVPLKN